MLLFCVDENEAHPPGPGHQLRGEDPLRLLPPLHREGGRLRKEGFPTESTVLCPVGRFMLVELWSQPAKPRDILQNHEIVPWVYL
jgi:hypothetical protein